MVSISSACLFFATYECQAGILADQATMKICQFRDMGKGIALREMFDERMVVGAEYHAIVIIPL